MNPSLTSGQPDTPQDQAETPAFGVEPATPDTETPAADTPQTLPLRKPAWDRQPRRFELPKLEMPQFTLPTFKKPDFRTFDGKKLAGQFGNAVKTMAVRGSIITALKMTASGMAFGLGASAAGAAAIAFAAGAVGTGLVTYSWDSWKEYKVRKAADPAVKFTDVVTDWTSDTFKAYQESKQAGATLSYKEYLAASGSKTNGVIGALNVAVWSKLDSRVKRAVMGLALGAAGGALIGGLMQLDVVQSGLERAGALVGLGTVVADVTPPPPPVVVDNVDVTVTETPPVAPVAAPAIPETPVAVETAPAVAAAVVSSEAVASNPFTAGLLAAGLDADASGQALKDAAHSILRDNSIAAGDRVAMAQALALASVEQGNTQAADFLLDLPVAAELLGVEMPAAVAAVEVPVVTSAPVEILETVAPLQIEELATVIPPLAVEAPLEVLEPPVAGAPLETQMTPLVTDIRALPPVSDAFDGVAAVCQVAATGATSCDINVEEMAPGDKIAFVSAENADVRVTTTLSDNSVAVPTRSFLNGDVVGNGVSRLRSLMGGIFRIG